MLFRKIDSRTLAVHTPAKLNLFLEVLGKRADGYHEVETLLVSIGLYDTLVFRDDDSHSVRLHCIDAARAGFTAREPSPTGIDSQSPAAPQDASNLVVRAADLLRKHTGVIRGVKVELHKRIPVAAGLAGGSSDAAATLAALNRLWQLNLSPGELRELAAQLGSDIGFFLCGTTAAVCRGRGERIEPLALPLHLHFVVVRPRAGLSTAEVYRHCQPAASPQSLGGLVDALRHGRLSEAGRRLHNALEVPAERLSTEVGQLRSWFSHQSVLGHKMSGSGTAYFGVCGNRRQAQSIASRLRAEQLGRAFAVQCRP